MKQVITAIQQSQLKKLQLEKISYNKVVTEVNIDRLIRPNYSSRVIVDNRLSVLCDNLTQFGFLGGIFVQAQNFHVIDGWHRVEIWRALGNRTIPCYEIICNPRQERQLHLRLNQSVAAFDITDFELNFQGFDLLEYGFTKDELFKPDDGSDTYLNFKKKVTPEGFVKLQTFVSKGAYERLKARKSELNAKTVAEVIEMIA